MISRQLGHAHAADKVRDYLAPHLDSDPDMPTSPEQRFVYGVLTGRPDEMVTEAELILLAAAGPLGHRIFG
jgi:hypothetical protein